LLAIDGVGRKLSHACTALRAYDSLVLVERFR
jgi:hypothetical protein